MRIGIAARADDIMHGTAEGIEAVPVERILGDRRDGAEIWQVGPHAVTRRQMRAMQRPRLAGKEALAVVRHVTRD